MYNHSNTAAQILFNSYNRVSTEPFKDDETLEDYQRQEIRKRAIVVQQAINATLRDLFLTMPIPPDDIKTEDGKDAYIEAIREWRKANGYPIAPDHS